MDHIEIRGARTHNLKNIDLNIKLNKVTCLCGPSGSGKTSIAFHTLLTESKRRFINSFPTDIKFFWDIPQTADVDKIHPVLPVWGLAQNNPVVSSRPAVIDLMGGFEDLSKIFFFDGQLMCPDHQVILKQIRLADTLEQLDQSGEFKEGEVVHFLVSDFQYKRLLGEDILPPRSYTSSEGLRSFEDTDEFWELFRVKWGKLEKIKERIKEFPSEIEKYILLFSKDKNKTYEFNLKNSRQCSTCGYEEQVHINSSFHLSPYNALGACSECNGHGMNLVYDRSKLVKESKLSLKEGAVSLLNYKRFEYLLPSFLKEAKKRGYDLYIPFSELPEKIWDFLYEGGGAYPGFDSLFGYLESKRYKSAVRIFIRSLQSEVLCDACEGSRLEVHARERSLINGDEYMQMGDFCLLSINEAYSELLHWKSQFEFSELARPSVDRLIRKFEIAKDLGLGHVSLSRRVRSLSAGEYQRCLLNKFLSFEGSGSLFIFDEPSLGLGRDEQDTLLKYFKELVDQENTVLLVDHSTFMQSHSDEVVLMGPGAGDQGGSILFQGPYKDLLKNKELSLASERDFKFIRPTINEKKQKFVDFKVIARDSEAVDVKLPHSGIVWVNGKSGSGKTTYIVEGCGNKLAELNESDLLSATYHKTKSNLKKSPFKNVLLISGESMKTNARSTVGTYLGISPYVRKHYCNLAVSKSMALRDGHFSPNSELGKCQTCEGRGLIKVEMSFLEDVQFTCDDCKGMKLRPIYAQITDGVKTYHQAVSGPIEHVFDQIKLTPKLRRLRELFKILNLGHLSLDRTLSSLSGGEKQRLKLLSELHAGIDETAVFFENISFGLSVRELNGLCELFVSLGGKRNLLVIVDQNSIFEKIANYSLTFKGLGEGPEFKSY